MCGCASRERSATYAVPAFACDASMMLMLPAGRFGGVTFAQVLPSSRVTCTSALLVPTQIVPAATGDGASDVIDPPAAGAPTPVSRSAGETSGAGPRGTTSRSGLIVFHVCPRSMDVITYCAAMYMMCGSFGEKASGGAPPKRSSAVG